MIRSVLEWSGVLLLVAVVALAAFSGLLMNLLFVLLLFGAVLRIVVRGVGLVRRRLYLGIWKRAEYPRAWRYVLQALLRCATWLALGFAVSVAVVPAQFTVFEMHSIRWMVCGAVGLLCLLEWFPGVYLSRPRNVFFAALLLFVIVECTRIYLPPSPGGVVLQSPLEGDWVVVQGGNSPLINHHFFAGPQRHALDLIRPQDGPLFLQGVRDLASYISFGAPLLAPVSGVVETVRDGQRDQPVGRLDPSQPYGNTVTLRTPQGIYVLLAHLQRGSIRVAAGQEVVAGQRLGRVGNSGNTFQPHLHIQAMTAATPDASDCRGLPLAFGRADGSVCILKRNDMLRR